jgi:hypothetical protein
MPPNNFDLPDYYDRAFEYDPPIYESVSRSTNLAAYREWRTLWARRHFHEAMEEYSSSDPDRTRTSIVLGLPYHPDFPEVFAQHIGSFHEDGVRLPLADVEHFLETTYGLGLKQPDCDYLIDVLTDTQTAVSLHANVARALQWLETKKFELPVWPSQSSSAGADLTKHEKRATSTDSNLSEVDDNQLNLAECITEAEGYYFSTSSFTWNEVDRLAETLGLIKEGKYVLSTQDKGALAGFVDALKRKRIFNQLNLLVLQEAIGRRYSVPLRINHRSDKRLNFFNLTTAKLKVIFPPEGEPRI